MPGSASGGGRNPWALTVLELLLQGHPGEFLPTWSEHQAKADVRPGVSDRELMAEAAAAWVGSHILVDAEKDRIAAVWLAGEHRPAYNLDTARRDELRGMIHRAVA